MVYHAKWTDCAGMKDEEKRRLAKDIAKLLAESAATVDNMFDVFQMVREYLIVCKSPRLEGELDES